MTELMVWKRNGKEEFGMESVMGFAWMWSGTEQVSESNVTDLQPVKVVPLDGITISEGLFEEMQIASKGLGDTEGDSGWIVAHCEIVNQILAENPHLIKPKPMMEPTNFGAVVEASARGDVPKQFWIKINDLQWQPQHPGFLRRWDELINPILISEGVVGK